MDSGYQENQDLSHRSIVVLTDRRPVEIVDGDWTEICRSEYLFSSFAVNFNAAANLIVRRHIGGQFLVYGIYSVWREGR